MTSARHPELTGRVAVVTGAAKGIGQAIVRRLAGEGMAIVAGDIDADGLDATVAELAASGADVAGVVGDLGRTDDIDRLFATADERFERVDLLVNNAADLRRRRLLDDHQELLEHQLVTNVQGPYLCAQRAAFRMVSAGSGVSRSVGPRAVSATTASPPAGVKTCAVFRTRSYNSGSRKSTPKLCCIVRACAESLRSISFCTMSRSSTPSRCIISSTRLCMGAHTRTQGMCGMSRST